ncbi:MAG: spore maturation protein [Firmicutes bacterium]|nr:spore maturation protein [Bacillota bacterium]
MNPLFALSRWTIPLLFLAVPLLGFLRRLPLYQSFIAGAKDGLLTGLNLTPYLLAMLVAVGLFRATGGIALLARILAPLLGPFGIPPEIVPLALVRPLSGSGALGLLADLFAVHGPDSHLGRLASVVYGSTETTFYVLTVYLGAVGVRRRRHTWLAGLAADLVAFAVAVMLVGK